MDTPSTAKTDRADVPRVGRGLRPMATLLFLILGAAGLYAIYLIGQLDDIRRHNLHRLDLAAQAMTALLDNSRTTIASLSGDPAYACTFFQRQVRLELVEPACTTFGSLTLEPDNMVLVHDGSNVEIVQPGVQPDVQPGTSLRIRVRLDVIIDQIPFGDAFDQLMIVTPSGGLIGTGIRPRRSSPMEPPGVDVEAASSPIRVIDLGNIPFAEAAEGAAADFASLEQATFVRRIALAGTQYDLMCQPLRVALPDGGADWWRLCGIIDTQRSFRRALDVAPHVVMLLLAFVALAIVSWPILKVLSISPRERLRFGDLYLTLVATLAVTMLLVVVIADAVTYWELRERSSQRLRALAADLVTGLHDELHQMYRQLEFYDRQLADQGLTRSLRETARTSGHIAIGCLHLDDEERRARTTECQQPEIAEPLRPALSPPSGYPWMELVFWMRPCDGYQFVKASTLARNTPPVALDSREYFRAVKTGRLWNVGFSGEDPARARVYVDTSASVTTGLFFAAISAPSDLTVPDQPLPAPEPDDPRARHRAWQECGPSEDEQFAVALTAQPVSVQYPVLAPGVGFAIIDASGRAVFHSDVRRAVHENLLDDEGVADRLRAAMATQASADFYATYQTRPHQLHIRPLPGLPWFAVTFADDEVLRTWHTEWLARTAILLGGYLLIALLTTAGYMLLHGREPPSSVWPGRDRRMRPLYHWTIWSLAAQLAVFVLSLGLLNGAALAFACVVFPIIAFATVAVATRQARALSVAARGDEAAAAALAVVRTHRRLCIAAAGASLVAAVVLAGPLSWADDASRLPRELDAARLMLLVAVAVLVIPLFSTRDRLSHALADASSRAHRSWHTEASRLHVAATSLVWLLVGALPGYGLYTFALASQMKDATRQEQAYVARALRWRACEVQDDLRSMPLGDNADRLMQRRLQLPSGDSPRLSDVYPRALLARSVTFGPGAGEPASGGMTETVERTVFGVFPRLAPVYNDTITYARYLTPLASGAADGVPRWSWIRSGAEVHLVHEHRGPTDCDAVVPVIASQPAMLRPQVGRIGWIGLVGFLLLLVAWVSHGVRRIFFGDVEDDAQPVHGDGGGAGEPSGDWQLGRLGDPADRAWALAEIAPIAATGLRVPENAVEPWCGPFRTRRAVADRVLEAAHEHYEKLWTDCSREERLLLVQLVEERIANPKQAEVVRALLRRGLLRRDPMLRPMNNSFALFVEHRVDRREVKAWESEIQGLRWSHVRTLLIAALAIVIVFLSVTQRDAVEVWLAYLGTAAAGTAGVLRLLGAVNRSAAQQAAE